MGFHHLMVLNSNWGALTVVDRTICVYVLSLAIKPLSIRTAALTIAPLALLDNQLVFKVIIIHGLDQPNGDSLKREKITSALSITSPILLILLVNGGNLIPLLIVVNSNFNSNFNFQLLLM
jgi:hypothetical protein